MNILTGTSFSRDAKENALGRNTESKQFFFHTKSHMLYMLNFFYVVIHKYWKNRPDKQKICNHKL